MKKKKPWRLSTQAIKSIKKKPNKTLLFLQGSEPWARGDVIFVQEEWRIDSCNEDGQLAIDYKADPRSTKPTWISIDNDPDGTEFDNMWRSVCDELIEKKIPRNKDGGWSWAAGKSPLDWRPTHTMPEWASRYQFSIVGWETTKGSNYSGRGIDKDANYTKISLVQSEDIIICDSHELPTT